MKKILSLIVLVFFSISLVSPSYQVFAQTSAELQNTIDSTQVVLEKLEDVALGKIDTLQDTGLSEQVEERLVEKSEEIQEYVSQTALTLEQASTTSEVQETLVEAKKTVALKIVSGLTEYEDIASGVPQEVAKDVTKKEEATEVLQDSLSSDTLYTLLLQTRYQTDEVLSRLKVFDDAVLVEFLYSDDGLNYFQVQTHKDTLLGKELLSDIDLGEVPEKLLGFSVIQPEIFTLTDLQGEDTVTPWGIKKYAIEGYISSIPQNSGSIQVGVIDTGIDYRHPDLAQNVVSGYDFVNNDNDALDDQGHGTHVAGTIAAAYNHEGIVGVNPFAQLVPLKICTSSGFCPSYAILQALDYVQQHHIPVVNMSLGGRGDPTTHPICSAISAVTTSGTIVVAAAGNSNVDTSTFVPGGCSNAITVAAVDENLQRAGFSNYGQKVDVSAPGVSIYSTTTAGTYKRLSGTSMAAPHITGVVSLLREKNSSLTTNSVKALFKNSGTPVTTSTEKTLGRFIVPSDVLSHTIVSNSSLVDNLPESTSDRKVVFQTPNEQIREVQQNNMVLDSQRQGVTVTAGLTSKILDYLGIGERFDTHSVQEAGTIQETVSEIVTQKESQKGTQYVDAPQYFDSFGNPLSGTSIANVEEDIVVQSQTGTYYDGNGIPQVIPYKNINEPDNFIEPESENVELLIDGASKPIQINSATNFESHPILPYTQEPISGEMEQATLLSLPTEQIDYSFPEHVFIDGATQPGNFDFILDQDIPQEVENNDEERTFPLQEAEIIPNIAVQSDDESGEGLYQQSATGSEIQSIGDESFILSGDIGVQSAASPITTTSIFHSFTSLADVLKYRGFFLYKGTKYALTDTARGTLGASQLESKITDNALQIFTQDNYNYSLTTTPKTFFGKFSASIPPTMNGWNQQGYIGLAGSDDKMVLGMYLMNYQNDANNYEKSIQVDSFCTPSSTIDQTFCINHIPSSGKYLFFYFKKPNGKYSRASYKLQDSLSGDVTIDFKIDFDTQKLLAKVLTPTGTLIQEVFTDISGISKPENIDLSNFTYFAGAGTTNNTAQRTTPYEVGLGFTSEPLIPSIPVPSIPMNFLADMTTTPGTIQYGWVDAVGEDSYILRDETGKVIVSNISAGLQNIVETNVPSGTIYQRKICAVNAVGESCSALVPIFTPSKVSLQAYPGIEMSSYLYLANAYQYTFSDPGKLTTSTTSRYVYVTGNTPGVYKIYAKQNGVTKYIYEITVLQPPPPQIYNITVAQDATINVTFPAGSYGFSRFPETTGKVTLSNKNGYLEITGVVGGLAKYGVADSWGSMRGIVRYVLNITVIPKPPVIKIGTVYETKFLSLIEDFGVYEGLTFTTSDSTKVAVYVSPWRSGDKVIEGISDGYVEIYAKDGQGRHLYTFQITVLPKPIPQVYDVSMTVMNSFSVTLPEPIANYTFSVENAAIFGNNYQYLVSSPNTFTLLPDDSGNAVIHLKDALGFDRYVVHLTVKPYELYYTLNVTDTIRVFNNSDRSYVNKNPDIFSHYSGSTGTVTGLTVGQGQIYVYYSGKLRYIYYITVNPIPEPTQLVCNVVAGNRCYYQVSYNGYQYTLTSPNIGNIETTGSGIRINTISSGIVKVYLQSATGQYISHVITVNIASQPPLEFDCTIPLGYSCDSYEHDVTDGYSFTVTNPSVINVTRSNFFLNPTAQTGKYYQYHITGNIQGTTEVYIYKYNDHVATVHTTILPPVPSMGMVGQTPSIKEGESFSVKITGGVPPYRVSSYDSAALTLRLDQTTGDLEVIGKQVVGNHTVQIEDVYKQKLQFGVSVLDATVILSANTVSIVAGDSAVVAVQDYYVALEPLTQTDSSIATVSMLDEANPTQSNKPKKYVEITGKQSGTTSVTVRDAQGNEQVIVVNVSGSQNIFYDTQTPDEAEQALETYINSMYQEYGLVVSNTQFYAQEIDKYTLYEPIVTSLLFKMNTLPLSESKYLQYLSKFRKAKELVKNRGENYWSYRIITKFIDGIESTVKEKYGSISIVNFETTPTVEDGYVGGFYFKVDHPSLIREVGVEYKEDGDLVWSRELLENEGDGEFASLVLPKTLTTTVRGYIKDLDGTILYTKLNGDEINIQTTLKNYYTLDDGAPPLTGEGSTFQSVDESEINAIFLIPIAISLVSFGISVYADYQCSHEVDWINLSCAVSAGTTVLSVASLGTALVKKAVLKFATKTSTEVAASSLGKVTDDIAKLGLKIGDLNFSPIAYSHMLEPSRYVPATTLKDVINTVSGLPDPRGSVSLMYYSKIVKNGQEYNIEVLYEVAKNKIWHFKYTRDAIGNLPAIP